MMMSNFLDSLLVERNLGRLLSSRTSLGWFIPRLLWICRD